MNRDLCSCFVTRFLLMCLSSRIVLNSHLTTAFEAVPWNSSRTCGTVHKWRARTIHNDEVEA